MILSEEFKIKKIDNLSSNYIESELKKIDIEPLRWAIVEVLDDDFIVSVSYEKN